jgi:hypothetical protein
MYYSIDYSIDYSKISKIDDEFLITMLYNVTEGKSALKMRSFDTWRYEVVRALRGINSFIKMCSEGEILASTCV